MEPIPSPLDRAATIPLLRRLLAADALTIDEAKCLENRLRQDLPWSLWLDRGLLILGVILMITGVGYFFAHNWQHLTENDKLGLASGSVLVAFIAACYAGFDRFLGKLLLLAASLLVGVFIAVFGQIYQTGADTYELFLAWAVLIFPWVALGRFVPLWLFWLGLINLTVGFYWPVSHNLFFESYESSRCFRYETLSLLAINLIALVLCECAVWAKITWVDRHWSAWLLLTAALISITTETTYEIIRTWDGSINAWPTVYAVAFHAILILGVAFYFGRVRPSLPALALDTLSACWMLMMLAARLVLSGHADPLSGQWLFMGFLVLAIFGGGVFLLRAASRFIAH